MQKFEIVLKNEKEKTYRTIGWIIITINFISLALITASTDFKKISPLIYGAAALLIAILMRYLKPGNEKLTFYGPYLICFFAWISMNYWWAAIIVLALAILNIIAIKKLVIHFDEAEIKYPSLFIKRISWKQVSNAMIKDDILTIDFKNNKIIQQQVDETAPSVNEKEFNDFCRQQLKSSIT